jgi:thiol-disulfide isomerase/thioredoxin
MIRDMLKMFTGDILQSLSVQVHKHDLFEQKGERPKAPKLPPKTNSLNLNNTNAIKSTVNSTESVETNTTPVSKQTTSISTINSKDLQERLQHSNWKIFVHWATWCEGCLEELPIVEDLIQVLQELPEQIEVDVFGVSWDNFMFQNMKQAQKEVEGFYEEQNPSFSTGIISESDEDFFSFFALSNKTIPQVWLVNPNGVKKIFPNGIGLEEILDIQSDIQKSTQQKQEG